ncbi:lactonase family protein [Nocardia sp. CA-120079]|uniref:lactonase family protein n=1 Tax=Nocardia sp. CA-120079 TaxID=3239974 RepID=UPI003D986F41
MTNWYAYIGSRTTAERQGRGTGLSVQHIDSTTGRWTHLQDIELINPSYLCFGPGQRHLYVTHGDRSEVSAFSIDDRSGTLALLGTVPCGGTNPVHLVAADEFTLVVANYATGSVALIAINPDGSLAGGPHHLLNLADQGESSKSHPHQVLPDPLSGLIIVPDKGADTVFLLELHPAHSAVAAKIAASAGAGPRHALLHPRLDRVYVANELDSTVTTYEFDRARTELTPLQTLPTVPLSAAEPNSAAGIVGAFDLRFLYVSNRGHNSVACYSVDRGTGLLTAAGWTATGGECPRFITLGPTGTDLYATNERSDTIVALTIDPETGTLKRQSCAVSTGSPVCVLFRPATHH